MHCILYCQQYCVAIVTMDFTTMLANKAKLKQTTTACPYRTVLDHMERTFSAHPGLDRGAYAAHLKQRLDDVLNRFLQQQSEPAVANKER